MEGFHPEDRKTLITVEVEIRHLRNELLSYGSRLTRLEHDHVRVEDLRDLQVDIDDLRGQKADRSELSRTDIAGLKKDVENLQRWRWFERGAVLSIIAALELLSRFVWK